MVELGRGGGGHAIGRYILNERTIRRERPGDNENLSCLCTNQGGRDEGPITRSKLSPGSSSAQCPLPRDTPHNASLRTWTPVIIVRNIDGRHANKKKIKSLVEM